LQVQILPGIPILMFRSGREDFMNLVRDFERAGLALQRAGAPLMSMDGDIFQMDIQRLQAWRRVYRNVEVRQEGFGANGIYWID